MVASDADMVATAYADGRLDRIPNVEDALTSIALPLDFERPIVSSVRVSNSVMSWPQIVAVSPDQQHAYVAEVRSHPPDNVQQLSSIEAMPEGEIITVVDIANLQQPRVIQTVSMGRNPKHLSISPNGQLLAINLEEAGRELVIAEIQPDGTLGEMTGFSIAANLPSGVVPEAAIWHPSGNFLALTTTGDDPGNALASAVAFYTVTQSGQAIQIQLYDRPLAVGNHLSHARFTADGRFLLVPDLKWRMHGLRALNYLLNRRGEMTAIRFEPEQNRPPEVTSRAVVGLGPEGFALSPDNRLIATVNLRRTYLSPNLPPAWRGKPYSSLSLVQLDPQSGQLTTLEEYGFEGLLPEQATFDATGDALAVVIYHNREPNPRTGVVEFWNVVSGDPPRLERTGFRLDVVRGAHDIVLVP
ncbi:lactonase family protein [Pseudanabaena sp. FACHB-2040]|uniref:lactonase family protein n=1 Tax=Pseudanabaena sp. FACHB-2040 TaxID=2692859 RepID=UPI001F54ADBD|nr:lactonase family protein [Pseudanabaena sp. FACHB-2040]